MIILPSATFDSTSAVQHLSLLGYQPGNTVHLRFIPGKGYELKTFHRSYPLQSIPWEHIQKLQSQGYGVYVAVNGGQCDKDVPHGRALFLEWDNLPKSDQWERLREMEAVGFPSPTFVVETRRSLHCYWTLSEPLPVETWKALQAELLRLTESDPTISNPSRVMRLAGSWHIAAGVEPVHCPLHLGTGQPITPGQLKHGLRQLAPPPAPENLQTTTTKTPMENRNGCATQAIDLIPFLAKQHQLLIETGAKTGSRNTLGYALACDLIGVENWLASLNFAPLQSAYELFLTYCQRCDSVGGWCSTEWNKIWQSALKTNPKPCCSDNVLSSRLRRIVGAKDEPDGEQPTKKSVAKLLIGIAESECDLWLSHEGDAWADIFIDGVRHSYPVRSAKFKRWLSGQLWLKHEMPSNSEAMQSALLVIESKAEYGGAPKRPVYLRVGQHEGHIYIDTGDERNRAIEVSAQGWRVIESSECPVRFHRGESQQPLPLPVAGGNLEQLWQLIPVASGYRRLLLAWLGFCLVPTGAKPILTLHGPKGAGKSTTATILKRLVDPGMVDLLALVGDTQSIATNARRRLILAYDNISSLTTAQQDALCRVATGCSFTARKLYTDLDESYYTFVRPQILTSVDCVPTRSDLLDRCLLVELDRIDESLRLPESEIWAKFDELAPSLLGAVLDMVATGLRNQSKVSDSLRGTAMRLPRMAEFARFGAAALGEDFLCEYRQNIANAEIVAVESNPVASAIQELVAAGDFEGTATQLLIKLQNLTDCPKIQKLTSRGLGRLLSSKAFIQDLQAVGVSVDSYRTKSDRGWIIKSTPQGDSPPKPVTFAAQNRSLVQIEESNGATFSNGDVTPDKAGIKTSQTSQTSPARHSAGLTGDIIGDVIGMPAENVTKNVTTPESGDVIGVPAENVTKTSPKTSPLKPRHSGAGDINDVCDVFKTPLSGASGQSPIENVTKTSPKTSPLKPRHSGAGDVNDVCDVFIAPLSGASGQSPIEKAAQKLADCFDGKVIQPDLEQWIGKNVEYQGRDCLLVDYLPVSGYCQIESGGKILLVPCTEISKALDCPF
jgi:hypothetical protein